MPLSPDEARRFAVLLESHAEQLTARWTELATTGLRGRLSSAELQRQTSDLQRATLSAKEGSLPEGEQVHCTRASQPPIVRIASPIFRE